VWLTEDQIIAAIDRTRRMAERKLKKSQELAEVAKTKFGKCEELRFTLMGNNLGAMERESMQAKLSSAELSAGKAKEKADACAAAYHRAINSTLPRLGEILSAFRTQPMTELVGEYKGVAIR
jgi:hypothetical protein